MFYAGDQVRVLPPFDEAFPGAHVVAAVRQAEDGQTIVELDGIEPAFAPEYLEAAS